MKCQSSNHPQDCAGSLKFSVSTEFNSELEGKECLMDCAWKEGLKCHIDL